ncbi:acylphosphatase [Vibrio ostreicida]|uniref:Acylphosphatase n=1 Tax=Vibrio ostreicida TaxID=526588 RepID=A0ABT8BUL8_9VIBR|nr:acylphosphatase [Vibrio ostreicida]MDN3610094.1 acylphosphatase [Vibrio ostreicida]NPD10036.1 acylphosphatase [Vibrio ostreicida]
MNLRCEKFTVTGRVQGVGFRYHTSYQGLIYGLTGYAKNLSNGDVEVVVCGTEVQIAEMAKWLKIGPKTSCVDSVKSEPTSYHAFEGFEIL